MAVDWLENKALPFVLSNDELKNAKWFGTRLEPSQDIYILINRKTEIKPKKNKGFFDNPLILSFFILINNLLIIFNNLVLTYHF